MGTQAERNFELYNRFVVVVGVDLSDVSEHLLMTARDFVRVSRNAEIHIIHVIAPTVIPALAFDATPMGDYGDDHRVRLAREKLDRLCARVADGISARVVVHVAIGRPTDEIANLAEAVGANVIVIESHTRHGLARVFHRSVAATLAERAPCSVLTVRSTRDERASSVPPPPPSSSTSTPSAIDETPPTGFRYHG